MWRILWAIVAVLFILWLIGFAFRIAGSVIHILLIVALALLLYNLIVGAMRRR